MQTPNGQPKRVLVGGKPIWSERGLWKRTPVLEHVTSKRDEKKKRLGRQISRHGGDYRLRTTALGLCMLPTRLSNNLLALECCRTMQLQGSGLCLMPTAPTVLRSWVHKSLGFAASYCPMHVRGKRAGVPGGAGFVTVRQGIDYTALSGIRTRNLGQGAGNETTDPAGRRSAPPRSRGPGCPRRLLTGSWGAHWTGDVDIGAVDDSTEREGQAKPQSG